VPWPHQLEAFKQNISRYEGGTYHKTWVTQAPTGAGKSEIFSAIIKYVVEKGMTVALYCCRNLLIDQLIKGCQRRGIEFGTVAAAFNDRYYNPRAAVQICSLATVAAQKRKDRMPKPVSLVIVDEAHQQKETTAIEVFDYYKEKGAKIAGFTATPVGISHIYDELVQVVTNEELRDPEKCGGWPAHLPAITFGCPEIDTTDLKPIKSGEFSVNDIRKTVWTPQIFGHVHHHYKRLNPNQRPAVLFAPGVKESKWFVDQFEKNGVKAAHIDGSDCYVDGEEYPSDPDKRAAILERLRSGEIKVLCNRFVLREGIDIVELAHIILACPIGSITSYVQTVGRVLRNHESLKAVLVQDHGGNWWRHGEPGQNIDWSEYFYMDNAQASKAKQEKIQTGEEKCAIICPNCSAVRESGAVCGTCGFKHEKSKRMVIQKNGQLIRLEGDPVTKRRTKCYSDTEKHWQKAWHRARRAGMTFNQARGIFVSEQKYWPPNDMPLMPKTAAGWYKSIKDATKEELY
jgi:superfamily II DNA or RNA helicase